MTLPDEATPPPRPPGRIGATIARLALWLGLFLLGATLALLAVLHTPFGMRAVANVVLGIINPWPATSLTIAGARPGFATGLEFYGARLRDRKGRVLLAVDTLRARYTLPGVLRNPYTVQSIQIAGPTISTRQGADGTFDLLAPFLKAPAARPSPIVVRIDRMELWRGSLRARLERAGALDSLAFEQVFASSDSTRFGSDVALAVDTLGAVLRLPAGAGSVEEFQVAAAFRIADDVLNVSTLRIEGDSTRIVASGPVPFDAFDGESFDGLRVRVEAAPLAAQDLARVTGTRGPADIRFVLEAEGQGPALDARLDARALGGTAKLRCHAQPSKTGPFQLKLSAQAHGLDLGTFTGDSTGRTVAEASLEADLNGASRDHVSGPLDLVLDGTRWSGTLVERGVLSARFTDGALALRAEGEANDHRLIATAGGRPFDARPTYQLDGTLSVPPLARADARDTTASPFVGDLVARLRGAGASPAEAQLQVELHPDPAARSLLGDAALDARLRYQPAVRGGAPSRFSAEVRSLDVIAADHALENGSGRVEQDGARWRVTLEALVDSARVRAEGSLKSSVAPRGEAALKLRFDDLDLARVTDDTTFASRLAGTLEVALNASDLRQLLAACSGRGQPPPGARGQVDLALEPSTWRDQRIERLALNGRLAGDAVDVRGDVATSFGRARLQGTARPFDAVPSAQLDQVDIDDVDLRPILRRPNPQTDLDGRLAGEIAGRDRSTLSGRLQATLDGSTINRTRFDRLRLVASLDEPALDARLESRAGADGADVRLHSAPGLDPTRVTMSGNVHFDDLGALLGIDLREAGVHLAMDASLERPPGGPPQQFSGGGHLDGRLHAGQARLDTLSVELRLASGTLDVVRFHARGPALEANGSGPITLAGDARDSSAFQIVGVFHDLQTLAPLIGAQTLSIGTGGFAFSASGPADATRLSGALTATRPHMNKMWADSIAVTFQGVRRDSTIVGLSARFDARSLATPPFATRDLLATGTWDGRVAALEVHGDAGPDLAQDIALRYEPGPRRQRLLLDRLDLRFPLGLLTLKHPTEIELGERFHVNDLALVRRGIPQVAIDGGIEPNGAIDFRARLDSIDVGGILRSFGEVDLRGVFSGGITVTGTRDQPRLAADWRSGLISGKRPAARFGGSLRWEASALTYNTEFLQSPGHRLELHDRVPLRLTLPRGLTPVATPVDSARSGALTAEQFDLQWFQPLVSERLARGIQGWLSGRVDMRGEFLLPELAGSLTLDKAGVELPRLGVHYRSVAARIALAGRTATLERATVRSGAGSLEASGTATLAVAGHPTVNLKATARRFEVANTADAKVEVSGDLAITGEALAPDVRGTLNLLNTSIYLQQGAGLGKGVETVELTEDDYRELQERFGYNASPNRGAALAALDSADVDVALGIGQNVWARRRTDPIVSLEMDGDARIRKPRGGEPSITGHFGIQTGRSYLSFMGRRFDITSAEVVMPGPLDQVRAEIAAQYLPSASQSSSSATVLANARIEGSTTTLDLRSEPYMERGDLINYLATGKTQGELESGSAAGLAVGSVIGTMGGSAGRSLGFQVVQVTMDSYGGQTLSAGNYVNPKTYLGFRQPVLEGQNSSTQSQKSSYATEFEVEVEAMKRLLFNMQGGGTQYRFLLRPRLGP